MSIEDRCREYAKYVLRNPSDSGRSIGDVLRFVLWGDAKQADAADRVWDATHLPEWKIPHLGPNILGEMLGYARPDDFPPRNHRVVKTLAALGYDVRG